MSWQRWLAGFDPHGDKQEDHVIEKFLAFDKIWKPHRRFLGGDLWDFAAIRRKANEDERRESMTADYDAGMAFLRAWQPNVFLRGNHDERLWDAWFTGSGPLKDLAGKWLEEINTWLKRNRCLMYPYDKRRGIHYEGHLKLLHGYFTGETAAKRHGQIYGACLFGHTHAIDQAAIPSLDSKVARSCGCLCQLDYDYNRAKPLSLRHAHGWVYGIQNTKTGGYYAWQAQELDGRWILPIDVTML